jgi:hypothetical protein
MLKYANRIARRPRLVGPFISLAAFLWFRLRREPLGIPVDTVEYVRREQWERLMALFRLSPATHRIDSTPTQPDTPSSS